MLPPPSSCRLIPVRNSDSLLARYTAACATSRASPSRVRCIAGEPRPSLLAHVGVAPLVDDVAGADRRAPDPVRCLLDGDRTRQRVERTLARRVGRETRARTFSLARRDVDDRSVPGRAHVRDRGSAEPHRCRHVHAERGIPRAGRHVRDRRVASVDDPGHRVVHEDGQPTERGDRVGHELRCRPPRRRGRPR